MILILNDLDHEWPYFFPPFLQYYLYNWRCPSMAPEKMGLVLQWLLTIHLALFLDDFIVIRVVFTYILSFVATIARALSPASTAHIKTNKQTNKRSRVMMRFPRIVDTFLFIQSCVYVRKRPTGGKEWLGNSNAKAGQKHSCQLFLFRETSPRWSVSS